MNKLGLSFLGLVSTICLLVGMNASAVEYRLTSLRFGAPAINDYTTISGMELGDILLDTNDSQFYGYNGSAWISLSGASSGNLSVRTESTTYTASASDDVIFVTTGSAWTLSLYSASGNSGKVLRIKKTSSDFNQLTIDAAGSETIDGALTNSVNTQYEEITLLSDGTNWNVMNRTYPTTWTSYNPTFTNFGTMGSFSFWWRRNGANLEIRGRGTAGTVASAEGRISFPANVPASDSTLPTTSVVGVMVRSSAVATANYILIEPSQTYFTLGVQNGSAAGLAKANVGGAGGALHNSDSFSVQATAPITGWN